MLRKIAFYFKHLMLMSSVNKIRLILTSAGIFVAVFLFSAGIIVSESYYNERLKIVGETAEYTAVISSPENNNDIKESLSEIVSQTPVKDIVTSDNVPVLSVPVHGSTYLTVMARFHGITRTNMILPIICDEGYLPEKAQLVEGRFISSNDLAENSPVVIIDEFTAELICPDESAVGKSIEIGGKTGGSSVAQDNGEEMQKIQAQIIGVVKNSYVSEQRRLSLKRDLDNIAESNIFTEVSVYCPINMISEWFPDSAVQIFFIYSFDNSKDYEDFADKAEYISLLNAKKGGAFDISTREALISDLENELSNTKSLLNLIMTVLCVISGISIMSVTFFSVKERISEIGIRKAFGASKVDIVFQFIFEMLIIAFFVSVTAVCLAYYCCKGAEIYLADKLFISFKVNVSLYKLALPVAVGLIEALFSSFVPSIYAANIKVTDSLRFE